MFFCKRNIGQVNVFYDILERKNPFLGYKNKKFEKWKICHFSKEVSQGFWSKIGHFSIFFFKGNIGQENVLRYSTTKERFSPLKKQEIEKIEKLSFFQRG